MKGSNKAVLVAGFCVLTACQVNPVHRDLADDSRSQPQTTAPVPDDVRERFAAALQLLHGKQYAAALEEMRRLAAEHPQFSGPVAALGIAHAQLGQSAAALDALTRAVQINPRNAAAWLWLGSLRRERGDYRGAEAAYLHALKLRPEHAPTHWNLAVLYDLSLKRRDAARHHYASYQRLAPNPNAIVSAWIRELEEPPLSLAGASQ